MSMIGKTLGHYSLSALLGKGGMGEVYQAKDQKLGRNVAIKVLPDEFAKDTDRVARFQREAKLLASLNHPNGRGGLLVNVLARMSLRQLDLLRPPGRRRSIVRYVIPASADHPWFACSRSMPLRAS